MGHYISECFTFPLWYIALLVSADVKVTGARKKSRAQVAPIVKLDEVVVTTSEENEDVLLAMKEKLYRFDKDASTTMQEHGGSDKSWAWHATDFSYGKLKEELFCIRLGSAENAKKFKEVIEEIAKAQADKSDKEIKLQI
eukprot:Gb_11616 [translate_table: standard]